MYQKKSFLNYLNNDDENRKLVEVMIHVKCKQFSQSSNILQKATHVVTFDIKVQYYTASNINLQFIFAIFEDTYLLLR